MKKIIFNIVAVFLICGFIVGVYISSQKGVFLFEGTLRKEVSLAAKRTVIPLKQQLELIQKKLIDMSARDLIVFSLAQFEKGESLEKGSLAFKQTSSEIPFISKLQLINMQNKVVIDSSDPTLEGRKLDQHMIQKITGHKKNINWFIMKNGTVVATVDCNTAAGRYVGKILCYIDDKIFKSKHVLLGLKNKVRKYLYFAGIIFYNIPENMQNRQLLEKIAVKFNSGEEGSYTYKRSYMICIKLEGFPFVFAYAGNKEHLGVPDHAILIMGGLAIVLLLNTVLLVIAVKRRKRWKKINELRNEMDNMGGDIAQVGASADEIIRQSEYLFQEQSDAEIKLDRLKKEKESVETDDESFQSDELDDLPSVDQILKNGEADEFKFKEKNSKLEDLINQVSSDSNADASDNKLNTFVAANNLDEYWNTMDELLNDSFQISTYMLLKPDSSGLFYPYKFKNVPEPEAMRIPETNNLIVNYLQSGKVIYLEDHPLQNKKLQKLLPGFNDEVIDQLLMIPVMNNGLDGILLVLKQKHEKPIDKYHVYELMYMSRL